MNKAELVSAVIKAQEAQGSKLAKGQIEGVVNSVFETIRDEVKTDGKVTLIGFGTFTRETRAERNGVNPSTREAMVIPAKNVVKFKPSSTFLD